MKINSKLNEGFTLIEIIITIVLLAIIMIPVGLIGMEYVRSVAYADSLTIVANLGRREMAIVNNTAYNSLGGGSFPNYSGYNFDVSRQVDFPSGFGNAIKRVIVTVYPSGSNEKLIELATYAMNVLFGAGGGMRAGSFSASGGTFTSWTALSDMALQNASPTESITMMGVIMTTNHPNLTLNSITMDGIVRFSGAVALTSTQEQILFQNNFSMSPNTTYSDAQGATFTFAGSDRSYRVTIAYLFSDGSQSATYTRSYTKPKR